MAFNPTYAPVGDNKLDVFGATPAAVWTITFGGADTYVAGGLALVASTFGLSRPIAGVLHLGSNTALSVVMLPVWNTQTQKLQLLWTGPAISGVLAEVSGSIANFAMTVLVLAQR